MDTLMWLPGFDWAAPFEKVLQPRQQLRSQLVQLWVTWSWREKGGQGLT